MGEVLIYFSGNVPEAPATSVAPVPGYSVMVQAATLDDSLLADPNLTFALNMRRVQARQRGIVQSIYSDAVMAGLVLVFSNFGLLVQGLVVEHPPAAAPTLCLPRPAESARCAS